jgi:heavy metal sensor kinase
VRSWWERRTLRFKLAAWYALGGAVLLTAFSATLYSYVAHRIARPLDQQLKQDLATVRAQLDVRPDGRLFWNGSEIPAGTPWPSTNPWFELWDEKGNLVRRLWPFADNRLEQLPVAPARHRETLSVFYVSPDIRLRVLSVPFKVEGHEEDWMVRAITIHEPAVDALRALLLIIAIALPTVVALLVIGGYALTRRWLRPLDEMVSEANRITVEDFSRRLPVKNPHDELGQLAGVFNATLARLEDSFVTLDRFVADAAHELRTPLTTLRSVGEVGLRRSRTLDEYREIIGSMLEEAQRLQSLVEQLLQLARTEGGAPVLQTSTVALHTLAGGCVNELAILAEDKGQQIVLRSEACVAETDAVLVRQALQNLLDNAIKYSPEGSNIYVTVRPAEGFVVMEVADEGPGVGAEHRERLTERFFRTDSSRVRDRGGFGLGLAISKAFMRVLGGTLEYEAREPRGSIFRLRLKKA